MQDVAPAGPLAGFGWQYSRSGLIWPLAAIAIDEAEAMLSDEASPSATSGKPGVRLSGDALREALLRQKEATPGIRARDAAKALGVSEAELVACRIGEG